MTDAAPVPVPRVSLRQRLTLILGRIFCGPWFKICYRFQRQGAENIPAEGPVMIIANHQSYLDSVILGLMIRRGTFRSVARVGLFKSKFFSVLISLLGAMPIRKEGGSASAIRRAVEQLKEGHIVVIFPEGRRTRDGMMHPFMGGVRLILKRAIVPVVLVSIEGTYDIWPSGRRFPRLRGRIRVRAHPVIPAGALPDGGSDGGLDELRRRLEVARLELREEIRTASRGRYPRSTNGDQPYWEVHPDDDMASPSGGD